MRDIKENELARGRCILVIYSGELDREIEASGISENFFGDVTRDPSELPDDLTQRTLFVCGDLSEKKLPDHPCQIIQELSRVDEVSNPLSTQITLGQVPHSIYGLGVLYPAHFLPDDLFGKISAEHEFQQLTESNKPSLALRSGIYLSEVKRVEPEAGGIPPVDAPLCFHLMRCSSNLSGPTDNFRETDWRVIEAVNASAASLFEREVELNHVLAQVYTNRRLGNQKQQKARIGAHSDKTKDMHPNGVMAFCSFYNEEELGKLSPSPKDPYDYVHHGVSGLTQLYFKLKKTVEEEGLIPEFSVTLYPNSVFFMPLSTNRLYTHEIRPSQLDAELVPTRMGYVVRCSGTKAIHDQGQTFIIEGEQRIQLVEMKPEDVRELKDSYYTENATDHPVDYDGIYFSMNAGDYLKPIE